mgnify:CR=1 FL=1
MSLIKKIQITIMVSLIFLAVSLPVTYKMTDKVITKSSGKIYNKEKGCPTIYGQLLHTIVFGMIVFMMMFFRGIVSGKGIRSVGVSIKHTIYSTLLYSVVSSPSLYMIMRENVSERIASATGCPTIVGTILHNVVYSVLLIILMYLPDEK